MSAPEITAGLAAASTRWRDRRLAVAELRRRGAERGALRRRNTTDTHSRLKPLLYVLLTLSYQLALIAITSALCTNPAYLCTQAIVTGGQPNESSAPHRGRDLAATGAARSAATSYVTMTRS